MKLCRNHQLAPKPLDPRYPLRGFRVIGDAGVTIVLPEAAKDQIGWQLYGGVNSAHQVRGSFFALKPGEKGKHGTIGGEAR
jgi:hypothetical protein